MSVEYDKYCLIEVLFCSILKFLLRYIALFDCSISDVLVVVKHFTSCHLIIIIKYFDGDFWKLLFLLKLHAYFFSKKQWHKINWVRIYYLPTIWHNILITCLSTLNWNWLPHLCLGHGMVLQGCTWLWLHMQNLMHRQ